MLHTPRLSLWCVLFISESVTRWFSTQCCEFLASATDFGMAALRSESTSLVEDLRSVPRDLQAETLEGLVQKLHVAQSKPQCPTFPALFPVRIGSWSQSEASTCTGGHIHARAGQFVPARLHERAVAESRGPVEDVGRRPRLHIPE